MVWRDVCLKGGLYRTFTMATKLDGTPPTPSAAEQAFEDITADINEQLAAEVHIHPRPPFPSLQRVESPQPSCCCTCALDNYAQVYNDSDGETVSTMSTLGSPQRRALRRTASGSSAASSLFSPMRTTRQRQQQQQQQHHHKHRGKARQTGWGSRRNTTTSLSSVDAPTTSASDSDSDSATEVSSPQQTQAAEARRARYVAAQSKAKQQQQQRQQKQQSAAQRQYGFGSGQRMSSQVAADGEAEEVEEAVVVQRPNHGNDDDDDDDDDSLGGEEVVEVRSASDLYALEARRRLEPVRRSMPLQRKWRDRGARLGAADSNNYGTPRSNRTSKKRTRRQRRAQALRAAHEHAASAPPANKAWTPLHVARQSTQSSNHGSNSGSLRHMKSSSESREGVERAAAGKSPAIVVERRRASGLRRNTNHAVIGSTPTASATPKPKRQAHRRHTMHVSTSLGQTRSSSKKQQHERRDKQPQQAQEQEHDSHRSKRHHSRRHHHHHEQKQSDAVGDEPPSPTLTAAIMAQRFARTFRRGRMRRAAGLRRMSASPARSEGRRRKLGRSHTAAPRGTSPSTGSKTSRTTRTSRTSRASKSSRRTLRRAVTEQNTVKHRSRSSTRHKPNRSPIHMAGAAAPGSGSALPQPAASEAEPQEPAAAPSKTRQQQKGALLPPLKVGSSNSVADGTAADASSAATPPSVAIQQPESPAALETGTSLQALLTSTAASLGPGSSDDSSALLSPLPSTAGVDSTLLRFITRLVRHVLVIDRRIAAQSTRNLLRTPRPASGASLGLGFGLGGAGGGGGDGGVDMSRHGSRTSGEGMLVGDMWQQERGEDGGSDSDSSGQDTVARFNRLRIDTAAGQHQERAVRYRNATIFGLLASAAAWACGSSFTPEAMDFGPSGGSGPGRGTAGGVGGDASLGGTPPTILEDEEVQPERNPVQAVHKAMAARRAMRQQRELLQEWPSVALRLDLNLGRIAHNTKLFNRGLTLWPRSRDIVECNIQGTLAYPGMELATGLDAMYNVRVCALGCVALFTFWCALTLLLYSCGCCASRLML